MAPHRGGGGRTVAPLLSFPPSVGPSLVAAAPVKIPRRHPIVRAFLALPLVFVFVALLFPFWAYEMSMVLVSHASSLALSSCQTADST